MIKVETIQTIRQIELLYTRLDEKDATRITLPSALRSAQFGGVGSLLQWLITWSKRFPVGSLVLHTKEEPLLPTYLDNLSKSQHGLAALLLAQEILTSDQTSVRAQAHLYAKKAVEAMLEKRYQDFTGPEILIFSADHTSDQYRFVPQFYRPGTGIHREVRTHTSFIELADDLILNLSHRYKRSYPPDREIRHRLGTIFYELFKNTHRWAQSEVDGARVRRSIRGIRLELTKSADCDVSSQPEQIRHYVQSLHSYGPADILEISLFDSGPGLAKRGLDIVRATLTDATTPLEEYEAVIRCLRKHVTSSERDHHGVGLLEVMRTLTRARAFLRIRTGRLCLFRDFSPSADYLRNDADLWLNDWTSCTRELTTLVRAEGLLFSILIPIRLAGK